MSQTTAGKQYNRRLIDDTVEKYLRNAGAVCIEGPKWCGKTWTSSFHANSEFLVGNPENNFSNRQLAEINPSFVLQGEAPRMIDEWQEVPLLWDAVRAEVDRRTEKGQWILTGSATPQRKGILHSGAGRIVSLRMNTMTLYESGDSTGQISLKELCSGHCEPTMTGEVSLEKLAERIVRGGWPNNRAATPAEAHLLPRAYMQSVIQYDLQRLDDGTEYNPHKAELLLRSLARNETTTVSDASLLQDILEQDGETMSRNTVTKYLNALHRLFLFNNQKPFSPNLRSALRVKQAEKRHFADPAMACALLNITPVKLMSDLNTFGFLFEALAEHDLAVYAQTFGGTLYHYQDYKNNEIDAVIELEDGDWCAFEIKLGAIKIEEGAKNLQDVEKDILAAGGRPPKIKCVLCGMTNAAYQRPDGVFVVPLTAMKN